MFIRQVESGDERDSRHHWRGNRPHKQGSTDHLSFDWPRSIKQTKVYDINCGCANTAATRNGNYGIPSPNKLS